MEFSTYDHIASRMVQSLNSLGNYCYRRTRRTGSQHILEDLIYSLDMSICLRVLCRTEVQTGIHGLMQPVLELQSELGPSNRHDPLGHSMQIDYPRHIQL
jgi:hypothetical protein